ncbi:hypothetical protein AMECASPLE_033932 [Ameca splendens]|uniref:Uncharacterized protein n=1 Tax=Ameca splendens TaxID=208324 RepID=A0ABV1A3Q2_9TELE
MVHKVITVEPTCSFKGHVVLVPISGVIKRYLRVSNLQPSRDLPDIFISWPLPNFNHQGQLERTLSTLQHTHARQSTQTLQNWTLSSWIKSLKANLTLTLINLSRFQFPHVLSSWRFTAPNLLTRVSSRYRPNIYVPLINLLNFSDSPESSLHVGQIGV